MTDTVMMARIGSEQSLTDCSPLPDCAAEIFL